MKMIKKLFVGAMAIAISALICGCGKDKAQRLELGTGYADVVLGTTGSDLNTSIKFITQRTDMLQSDYQGKAWKDYIEEFNKIYPNIKINIEGITNYAEQALLRLQGGSWGEIMMIPAVDKQELPSYFLNYGSISVMKDEVRFADRWLYEDNVYGIPATGNAQGVLYNKRIFKEAGISSVPKTPDEFLAALRLIKQNTKAIPLYTNYAAGWTMGAWDDYISGSATGDANYANQIILHEKNPFSDKGDGTHPYAVYKILYTAVNEGLTEEDFSTTDWEGSKGMFNRGEIATMVLGSWAFTQMQAAGPNADDIGYMSFPVTVGGKQYASAGADYCFGVNAKSPKEKQLAALIFVKWMTEKSGFAFNEGGIPISARDNHFPSVYAGFEGIPFVADNPAVAGEEDLKGKLNADSELNIANGGNSKIQHIIEHAYNNDKAFDDIMAEWNDAWTRAQERNKVQTN